MSKYHKVLRKAKKPPLTNNQLVVIEKEKSKTNFSLGRIFAWMTLMCYLIFLFKPIIGSIDITWDVVANGAYPFSFLINCESYFEGNASYRHLDESFSAVVTIVLMGLTFLVVGFLAVIAPLICVVYLFEKSVLKENNDTTN